MVDDEYAPVPADMISLVDKTLQVIYPVDQLRIQSVFPGVDQLQTASAIAEQGLLDDGTAFVQLRTDYIMGCPGSLTDPHGRSWNSVIHQQEAGQSPCPQCVLH